jgi:iron complex outermembrane receptor protein
MSVVTDAAGVSPRDNRRRMPLYNFLTIAVEQHRPVAPLQARIDARSIPAYGARNLPLASAVTTSRSIPHGDIPMTQNRVVPRLFVRRPLALALAIAGALGAAPALRAQEDAAPAKTLDVITVTAEKRVEDVQKVPESITTIDPEKLDILKSGGDDVQFLSGRVPSLLIESSFGRTFPRFYIRGLGNSDFDLNASQPVSMVYDDIVLENPILKGFPVFDIGQVEVLRGPQGTLFGRNTPAGVVKFDSNKPTQETQGYVDASYGSYGTANLEAALGGALSETWSARVSVLGQHRDNWVDNTAPGRNDSFGGYNERAARLQFLYQPSDAFNALFNLHALNLDGSAILFRANIIEPGSDNLVPGFERDKISLDGRNFQHVTEHGGSARLTWDFADMELVSITGLDKARTLSHGDIDGGYGASFAPPYGPGFIPFPSETADGLPFHRQITQEVHLASKETAPWDWIVGVYYFNENITIDSFDYNTLAGGGEDGFARQKQHDISTAVFGSLGYQVNDAFKLKGGLRYTRDDKTYVAQRFVSPFGAGGIGPIRANPSDSHVTGDLSAVFTASNTTDFYARLATGYRAPSIQGRVLFGDSISQARAETVTSFEAGVKSRLLDNRATISFDVFDYEMKNQQLTAVGGSANVATLVNARKTDGHGFEFDAEAYLTDRLFVTAGTSYNFTEINDPNLYITPCGSGCTVLDPTIVRNGTTLALIDGNPLVNAPKWIANVTARYGVPVGDGEFFVYTDWAYRSKVLINVLYESAEYQGKPWLIGGLRVGYNWDAGRREVSFYGRNITDKKAIIGGIDFDNLTGYVNEPRIWGVQFRAEL